MSPLADIGDDRLVVARFTPRQQEAIFDEIYHHGSAHIVDVTVTSPRRVSFFLALAKGGLRWCPP